MLTFHWCPSILRMTCRRWCRAWHGFGPQVEQRTAVYERLSFLLPSGSFHSFDVEDSGGCRGDWLLLGPTWKEEYRVCGSVLPPPFISSRGRVWLHFHSQANSSGLAQGFRLSYIRSECIQTLSATQEESVCWGDFTHSSVELCNHELLITSLHLSCCI